MGLIGKTIDELIDLAKSTNNLNEMLFLEKNPSMNVRRALARNRNLYDEVLNRLLYDPVENVSYIASKHPNIKEKREFDNPRPCVTCNKDEKNLNCKDCTSLTSYYTS